MNLPEAQAPTDAGAAAPSGTVTFLFTDIEGSTRLMVALGDAYEALLDRHDELLLEVWQRHDGYVFNTAGDAFYVAFQDADLAVRAAVDAQAAIAREPWPDGAALRIRIGLHRGYARSRRGDYAALAVNQTARVVSAAHGGQILLSEAAAEAVRGAKLRSLGRFRVRDFEAPEPLHLVEANDWPCPDLPPRVQPAEGHNLVRSLTPLVGRTQELAALTDSLAPGCLVTLLGPGGVGKTRLAVEAGFAVADTWPDGVWFVALAAIGRDGDPTPEIAAAVGATQVPGRPSREDLHDHLRNRQALVILDNCEHLAAQTARIAHDLMVACPGVGILATSRVPLGLRGELVQRLPSLDAEDAESPAVRLFLERVGGDVDARDLSDVVTLCRELDGLPLALELAAARASAMSAAELLQSFRRSPDLLRSADPTLPDRHRTMDRVIDWSLALLDDRSKTILRQLSVPAGALDMTVAGVACDMDVLQVSGPLWDLVDHSLVRPDLVAGATRFRLPVPVRLHLVQQLSEAERIAVAQRLARHYIRTQGPSAWDEQVMGALVIEIDTIRGVVAELADTDQELSQSLAVIVATYHVARASYANGIAELTPLVEALTAPLPGRVALLARVADIHLGKGDLAEARVLLAEADSLQQRVGAPEWDRTCVLRALGEMAIRDGRPDEAARYAEAILETPSTPWERIRGLNLLGIARTLEDDLDGALATMLEEVAVSEAAGLPALHAVALGNLAEIQLRLGMRKEAAGTQARALSVGAAIGDRAREAFSVIVAASLAADEGRHAQALALHVHGLDILAAIGWQLYASDAERSDALLATSRAALGPEAFERVVAEGHSMASDMALAQTEQILLDIAGLS